MARRDGSGGYPRRGIDRRIFRAGAVLTICALAAGCNAAGSKLGVSPSERVVEAGEPVPKGGGNYKVGKPYRVAGRWFHPEVDPGYDNVGLASWYGAAFHGRQTANGEVFDMNALTAAHPTLPMPTYARVTNLQNGSSVVVRVNDRGPFAHNRLIDVSKRTAEVLDLIDDGTAEVRVQYVGPAPLEGGDEWLTTTVRRDGETVEPVMVASATGAAGVGSSAFAPVPEPRPMTITDLIEADARERPAPAVTSGYAARDGARVDAAFALFDRTAPAVFPSRGH